MLQFFFLIYTRTDQKQSTQRGYLILKVKINPVVTPGELLSAVNVIARSERYVHVNLVMGGGEPRNSEMPSPVQKLVFNTITR